ncbi:winged helix-turn-helix domain-containing protein [Celeribacter sp. PS-C1]|uniref:winged helix-turn-helix domain-containing protein n=1 Tax=Celeribacter sp. PS-C1 TaxID=2820813 RepID=UPI001CA53999|nr:winged helix-turn-helix domain-containing protein [Celeribacter sp. PS-C1]MBW6417642.1 winged helix-turn-helix domain-containing protein [Celeribacter sp. PS-C1]
MAGGDEVHYAFDDFVLDLDRGELRHGEEAVSMEPMAYAVLGHLVQNAERLVARDELIEKVWEGRFISDAAVSTVIKSLRRALGDDGKQQRYIRTVHGRGFRFGTEVRVIPTTRTTLVSVEEHEVEGPSETAGPVDRKPTLAVLPFDLIGISEAFGTIADAIPGELISTLSRLRWLSVIARGSSFRFRPPAQDIDTIRAALGVTYVLSGEVELLGRSLGIAVELVDAETAQVVWGDRLSGKIDDVHEIRERIVALVVSALELHVPQHEAQLAHLRSPSDLDAWSLYHLGLQHAYRFNKADNATAADYFRRATELDPHFARAHAARSFVSFQDAFLRYSNDRPKSIEDAQRHAERSLELDPLDPFANFTFGRANWLRGDPLAGQSWLERSVSLSPSFAQGFYAHVWADIMAGDGGQALGNLKRSVTLSPLDPFRYAMLSAKGIAHFHQDNMEEGAYWAEQGARTPGAHYLISAFAAAIHQVAGHEEKALYWASETRARRSDATIDAFFKAFPIKNPRKYQELHGALKSLGFPQR